MAYRISANGKYGILLYWFWGNGEVIIINETYFAIFGKLNFIQFCVDKMLNKINSLYMCYLTLYQRKVSIFID